MIYYEMAQDRQLVGPYLTGGGVHTLQTEKIRKPKKYWRITLLMSTYWYSQLYFLNHSIRHARAISDNYNWAQKTWINKTSVFRSQLTKRIVNLFIVSLTDSPPCSILCWIKRFEQRKFCFNFSWFPELR